MPSYLQKRRRCWYAVLEIPDAVREHLGGKARFVKSLETDSRTVAERRRMYDPATANHIGDAQSGPR
jgi:hypothetical protein